MIDVTLFWRSWLMAFPWPSWNGGGLHGLKSATESADEFTRGGSCRFHVGSVKVMQIGCQMRPVIWRSQNVQQWFEPIQFVGLLLVPSFRCTRLILQGPHCDSGMTGLARRGSIQEQIHAAASTIRPHSSWSIPFPTPGYRRLMHCGTTSWHPNWSIDCNSPYQVLRTVWIWTLFEASCCFVQVSLSSWGGFSSSCQAPASRSKMQRVERGRWRSWQAGQDVILLYLP